MARQPAKEIPAYDPWAPYQIRSHNKKYTGDANGVRFVDGLGVVNALYADDELQLRHEGGECSCALAKDGTEVLGENRDECQERIEQLMWFWNANPLLKKVPANPDEPEDEQVWKTFTAYLIEPYDPNARRNPRRNQPIAARELVEAATGSDAVAAAGAPIRVKGGA